MQGTCVNIASANGQKVSMGTGLVLLIREHQPTRSRTGKSYSAKSNTSRRKDSQNNRANIVGNLQRSIGNQALKRLIQMGNISLSSIPTTIGRSYNNSLSFANRGTTTPSATINQGNGSAPRTNQHHLLARQNKLSFSNQNKTAQAKERTNSSQGLHEKQADRVAEQVMADINGTRISSYSHDSFSKRTSPSSQQYSSGIEASGRSSNTVSINTAPVDTMEPVYQNVTNFGTQTILLKGYSQSKNKEGGIGNNSIETGPPSHFQGGFPLDTNTRRFMESRFRYDFGNVRVHTGVEADHSAQSLNAVAYTTGNNIVFSSGMYAPSSQPGQRLLAHELTHVVSKMEQRFLLLLLLSRQQALQMRSRATSGSENENGLEREARQISAKIIKGHHSVAVHGRANATTVPLVQRQEQQPQGGQEEQKKEEPGWLEQAWEDVTNVTGTMVWDVMNRFAPDLVPILREVIRQGVFEWLKNKIFSVVNTVVETIMSPIRAVVKTIHLLSTHFANLIAWITEAGSRIAEGDCGAITEEAEKIQQVVQGISAPIVDGIKEIAAKVGNFFTGLWEQFGAPVWEWLKRVGGAIWEGIQQFGIWLWEKTARIRDLFGRAWTWIKNQLGIGEGPEGQNGLLQWLQDKASAVWKEIKAGIEPIKKPLMVIGSILVMLSPAGPIIAIGAAVAGVITGIRWIRQNFRSPDGVVNNREILRRVILPRLISSVRGFSKRLQEIGNFNFRKAE